MRRLLLVALVVAVGGTLWITASQRSNEVVGDDPAVPADAPGMSEAGGAPKASGNSKEVPIDIGLPEGPFDPVLVAGVEDPLRMPPPANKVVNDPSGENTGVAQSEVSIAVNGDKIVVAWNDGQGFVNGSNLTGVGYSTDRGETWTDQGDLPGAGGVRVFGDPTLAALPNDWWVAISLNRGSSDGIAVNVGDFSGAVPDWENAFAYEDNFASLDKEYIEYDPTIDRLYMSYARFGGTTTGRLTYSDDGGINWSGPLTVNQASSNGYYPAIAPDGGVYVSWVQPLFQGNARMYCRYSSDGGVSWATDNSLIKQLSPQSGGAPQCFNRGANITWPSLAVDRSDGPNRGRVYAAYSDGGPGNYDCYLKYSDDNGQTWSDEILLNDNENTSEQFWPQVTTGPDGRITVGWYDRRNAANNNSLCDFYVTQSVDGGVTWGPNRRMSDMSVAWCGVPSNIAPNFGDYIECISDDRSVFAVWADARNGDPDVLFGRMDDYQTVATTGAFGGRGLFATDATAYFIPNEAHLEVSPSPLQQSAEVAFASTLLGLLATPPETRGVFHIGGEALSGTLNFSSEIGSMTGDFSLVRTGVNDIDLSFDVTSNVQNVPGLFLNYTMQTDLFDDGPGAAVVAGHVRIGRFGIPPIQFSVSGSISFDGDPGASLENVHRITQENSYTNGANLVLHTRTMVDDGVVVSAPDISLGTNPPPLAVISQSPNPWAPGAVIRFDITHDASDLAVRIYTPEGRLVREVTSGTYRQGSYELPFDGKDSRGRDLPNGAYFLKLQANNVFAAAKLIVSR